MAASWSAAPGSGRLVWWLAAASAASASNPFAYHCYSDIELGEVVSGARKGLALDDTTLQYCSDRIPWLWPNTGNQVSSIRLFKAWTGFWPSGGRDGAWRSIRDFVQSNNATLLVGTQISCSESDDDQDWQWVQQLLQLFTPQQVMGVAIGNELDLLWTKKAVDTSVTDDCLAQLWSGGQFWERFQSRVADLDRLGFGAVPVTTVFTGVALGGNGHPFYEAPNAMTNTFLTNASTVLGKRFAFTFNFYPYFDDSLQLDPGGTGACQGALATAGCWSPGCQLPASAASARRAIQALTADPGRTFWVGETGWSSPTAGSLHSQMADCPAWSSTDTLRKYYEGFLRWDLDALGNLAPDHIFYFAMRDSLQFGVKESFGLVEDCDGMACKVKTASYQPPMWPKGASLSWTKWAFVALAGLLVLATGATCWFVRFGVPRCLKQVGGEDSDDDSAASS